MLDPKTCQKARLARDYRFDGIFFTAVKTTKIYCRPICPAMAPKETNVIYFNFAIEAANAGYRPCLRCRPDSAPQSPAWKGVDTTLERAMTLINQGALQQGKVPALANRLGISDRYLRQLFIQHLGISPKAYALYQQGLFAKQLLHQTSLPITQVALASGFNSLRRFNDYFRQQLFLTPSQVRRSKKKFSKKISLSLHYRPPYSWPLMVNFLQRRCIKGVEWCFEGRYGRTFSNEHYQGYFVVEDQEKEHKLQVTIVIDNIKYLKQVTQNIRRILDTDVDLSIIEKSLHACLAPQRLITGLCLPSTWSVFEAGVRAILGQQISVAAARNLVTTLVQHLGEQKKDDQQVNSNMDLNYYFPLPKAIAHSELDFLTIPAARRQTLRDLAQHFLGNKECEDPHSWLVIKGIGPWTVNYARMRGVSDPDVYLGGDLVIKKAQAKLSHNINPQDVAPWRSYLTLQLWNLQ